VIDVGKTIAIVNQKGGVGKSTTAVNLGAYLATLGKRVVVVDVDPQGNATTGMGVDKAALEGCMYDVLVGGRSMEEIIVGCEVEGLFVAPATIDLAGAEIELVSAISREYRLRSAMETIKEDYEYMLIDAPPSLGLLTLNGLTAADGALIPIQCEYYALEGLGQLMRTIELVRKHLNKAVEVAGVLMTMYDARTNLSQQVVEEVREVFKGKVFETVIPRNVRLSEAPSFGQPICLYDGTCAGAKAYMELAREVVRG